MSGTGLSLMLPACPVSSWLRKRQIAGGTTVTSLAFLNRSVLAIRYRGLG